MLYFVAHQLESEAIWPDVAASGSLGLAEINSCDPGFQCHTLSTFKEARCTVTC
jgi:hypothetical protein